MGGSEEMAMFQIPVETYQVIAHSAEEGGYWGEVVGFLGCVSQGETLEELIKNIREAIQAVRQNEVEANIQLLPEPAVSTKETFFFISDAKTGLLGPETMTAAQ
jgi:predicted RNase H-like HicB family nuclease